MPFKSKAQAGKLMGKDSPLSSSQKKEWSGATDWAKLPDKVKTKKPGSSIVRKALEMTSKHKREC